MIKTVNEVGIEGNFFNLIKEDYKKKKQQPKTKNQQKPYTGNIIVNSERLQASPQNQEQDSVSVQHCFGCSCWSNQARKTDKRHPGWKGRRETISIYR